MKRDNVTSTGIEFELEKPHIFKFIRNTRRHFKSRLHKRKQEEMKLKFT